MSESLPPPENLGVVPMPTKEEHMATLAEIKAGQDVGFGSPEPADSAFGPPEPVAVRPAREPVSFTAYKAARGPAPDRATKALALANTRGVSPQFAADNLEELQRQQDQAEYEGALGLGPLRAYAGQSAVHASAVKDDVTVLQALEMGLADVGYGAAARRYMDNPASEDPENLAAYEQASTEFAGKAARVVDPIDQLALQVARALPNVAAYGAASVLGSVFAGPAAGPAIGMGTALYQLNRGVLYRRIWQQAPLEDPDFDPAAFDAKAKEYAKKGALTGAVLGSILGDSFTRSLPFANKALQSIGQEIAAETLGKAAVQRGSEFVGHTLSGAAFMAEQAVVDNATVQKATTGAIDYGKAVEAGKDAGTEGLGVAAVLSAYTPGRGLLRDLGRLREAAPDVAHLDRLVETAKDSKLAQRSPEEAQALIGQMAAKGDTPTVYIAPEAAAQPEVAAKLVEALADEGRALAEAQATGADVVVPIEKYLTTVAPEFHDALREHVKLDPNGWTIKESTDFLSGPVAKLLAERTQIQSEPGPDQLLRLKDVEQRMRDEVATQYGGTSEGWQKALTAHAADTIGSAIAPKPKSVEAPASADALAWARKLTEERTIADLQPGRYERAAQLAADKLAKIATESAQKGQEAARQGFLGAGFQRIRNAVESAAGIENLQEAGKKADVAARKLADVPHLEQARDLARAQAKVQADVKAEMDKGREYIAKRDTDKFRIDLAKASPEYLDAFNAIQDAIDENTPRATHRPQALDALLLRMENDAESLGFDPDKLRAVLSSPSGWKALTPPEARNLLDAVKTIRSAARRQNEITLADRKETLREFVGGVRSYFDETNRPNSGLPPPSRASQGPMERAGEKIGNIATELLQPIRILRDRLGAPGNAIADAYVRSRNAKEEFAKMVGDHFYKAYEVDLPKELKRTRFDGVNGPGSPAFADDKWTRQDLWEFTSWWGSESGSERIKKGLRITDSQAHEFMSQLTNAEADLLEAKWKLNDEKLWPLIRDHERKKNGTAPAKIEARPFTIRTAEGDIRELRGGYEPARYRTDLESTAKAPENAETIADYWGSLRDGFEPTTATYFTKERTGAGRVPDLNWSMYASHVNSVLHYLAYDDFVRNTGRIFRDPEFRELVQRRLGPQEMVELDKFLGTAARGFVEPASDGASNLNRFIGNGLRGRWATAAFQLNPRIVLGQISHYAAAIPALKLTPSDILYGLSEALRPGSWGKSFDASEQLPYRWDGFGRHMREMLANIGPSDKPQSRKWLDAAGWSGYHVMDGFLSKAIYEAASSKAERAGADPTAARQAGDRAVELMMPPLNLAEQSSFARDRGVVGALLLVRNFPNTLYNVGAKLEWDARNEVLASDPGLQRAKVALGAYGAAAASYLGTVWAAHILGRFLMGHGRQPDESNSEWLEREALTAPFYPIPFGEAVVAPIAEAAVTHKTLKQSMQRHGFQAAPAIAELERAIQDLGKAVGSGPSEDRVFAGLRLAANALRLPSEPLKGVRYGYDLWSGTARPRGSFDVAGGFFYGKRPKQPKNPATVTQDFLSGD